MVDVTLNRPLADAVPRGDAADTPVVAERSAAVAPGSAHAIPEAVRQAILAHQADAQDPVAAFFYDLEALAERARWMMSALPKGVELFYAIKANSEAPMLKTLAPLVDGFELSSGGEIARMRQATQALPWVLSGPGKLDSEMQRAMDEGIEAFHVESLGEIARLERLAAARGEPQSVLLRINPSLPESLSSRLRMAGTATPFGIDEAELGAAVAAVEAASHLRLVGFHVHAMSHQRSVHKHKTLLDSYLDRWPRWRALAEHPASVTQLNVGGGIGVDYQAPSAPGEQFDWPALCAHLGQRLEHMDDAPRLRFEIGRFVSAFCGYYVMEVIDTKSSHGENFVICRGGTHQFRLPAAQGHDHPVVALCPSPAEGRSGAQADAKPAATKRWSVVGQLCTPKDVLTRAAWLNDPAPGDLLVLPLAGAYGYNISHADFLCHPRPEQCFISAPGRVAIY
ncbi:type III PLP-dependent enzyme [Halomonas sp. DP5Y7-2]|uniref:type III PLP-dependent enzyme n=1 Tax=Halomonas sp. DP5Y7-2 TaxID=2859076 RepID=UPI001C99B26D|nr:type III PLP-dependent enzyme [Halomonas sp. DP5Y7-2]MBY5982782.1 type III PLP-dependent enzyme [Halomonas sp. DP5Y7-2]